jgi:nitrate reductase NapAB chaperone NapD
MLKQPRNVNYRPSKIRHLLQVTRFPEPVVVAHLTQGKVVVATDAEKRHTATNGINSLLCVCSSAHTS